MISRITVLSYLLLLFLVFDVASFKYLNGEQIERTVSC